MAFRFMDLPPEMRDAVYEELLTINEDSKETWPQILATSRAIHDETTTILHGPDNKLIISITRATHYCPREDSVPRTLGGRNMDVVEGVDVTIGNRPSFWARSPESDVAEGLMETLRRWPRDLSKVAFIQIDARSTCTWDQASIHQQILVLAWLLKDNWEVQIDIIVASWDPETLMPLKRLRPGAVRSVRSTEDGDKTAAFNDMAVSQHGQHICAHFDACMAVRGEMEDFLGLQRRAGMVVRGAVLFHGMQRTLWQTRCGLHTIMDRRVKSRREVEGIGRQARAILDSAWVGKIKTEAHEKITAGKI